MSAYIYMKVTGATQGEIAGGAEQLDHLDKTEVLSFTQGISSPTDAASGRLTGKRQHTGVGLSCQVDKATVLYYQALCNNEILTSVNFEFFRTNIEGMTEHYFTVLLTNAKFSDIQIAADNDGGFDTASYVLSYEKIEWTWEDGGIIAMDDWSAPNFG